MLAPMWHDNCRVTWEGLSTAISLTHANKDPLRGGLRFESMLERLHSVGSRIRHSRLLERQDWLWALVEPTWQRVYGQLSNRRGFLTHVNGDVFRLEYAFGSVYDRRDHRVYEPTFYHAFADVIEEGMTVIDIGAHIGLFTLAAAKRVGTSGKVYAFEPAPKSAQILRRHIFLNGCQDRVEVIPAVVSDTDGSRSFYTHGSALAASLSRENLEILSHERLENATKIEATSMTIDQFCERQHVSPQVVKIDVEGAELLVLQGARRVLAGKHIAVFCEIHPQAMRYYGSSLHALNSYLDTIGYSALSLDQPNELEIFHAFLSARSERNFVENARNAS